MQNKYAAAAVLSIMLMGSTQAMAEGNNGVAAIVNGETITVAEMRQGYNDNKQLNDKVSFEDFYGKALDIYVNGKMLYQAAEAANITETPEYKKQVEAAKEEIARKVYLEKEVDSRIKNEDVQKLYGEYKASFKPETEIKAKHILVKTDAQAKEVIAKLKKGEKFDTLAKEYSKEPAELGYFTKKMMVPEFGNAAFAMKKGQYSQTPVKTQFGYHVIMVEDVRQSQPLPMKKVEPELKAMLAQNVIGAVFEDVNKNAKIEKFGLDGKPISPTVIPAAEK